MKNPTSKTGPKTMLLASPYKLYGWVRVPPHTKPKWIEFGPPPTTGKNKILFLAKLYPNDSKAAHIARDIENKLNITLPDLTACLKTEGG